MIYVVVMKCLTGLPLLIHIQFLWTSWSQNFKNWEAGVGGFVYRLHSPATIILSPVPLWDDPCPFPARQHNSSHGTVKGHNGLAKKKPTCIEPLRARTHYILFCSFHSNAAKDVSWAVTLCRLVKSYGHFKRQWCHHLHGPAVQELYSCLPANAA
jgi:hypothetical protein